MRTNYPQTLIVQSMNDVATGPASRIAAFKAAVAADLYAATDIVDLDAAVAVVNAYEPELLVLDSLAQFGSLDATALAESLFSHPRLYSVLCSFLSIANSVELEDGRRIPAPSYFPRDSAEATHVANLLIELGVGALLSDRPNVRKLMLVVQISADAPRRRFRADLRITRRVQRIITQAIAALNTEGIATFTVAPSISLPRSAQRIVEHLILVNEKPRIAVASTFQTHSGGRQTREMGSLYPSVQATLTNSGIHLVLLADGQGMRSISDRVLGELFSAVPYTMSLSEAESGKFSEAIRDAVNKPIAPSLEFSGLSKIVEQGLYDELVVEAGALPVDDSTARLALASYASSKSQLSLTLSADGKTLSWARVQEIRDLRDAKRSFQPQLVLSAVARMLGGIVESSRGNKIRLRLDDDPLFSAPIVVAAHQGAVDVHVVREQSRSALEISSESKVTVVVSNEPIPASSISALRDAQNFLPVAVVAVDLDTCIALATGTQSPRDRLSELLLEQTDLTKLSPFVVRGVTPARVFYGREEEEATLLSTLATNSVAILGGRRIGKTSLMRHSFSRLQAANLRPYFGDCQVVRTWADFGEMARRNWDVDVPQTFKPQHLIDLVDQLRGNDGAAVVILLDEIDQLLDWDKAHTEDEVPEAFFRACRSISQQGQAQFVFSGERTIAQRMWDATSPHWNFCRPLMLRQLTRVAADNLMLQPLGALGVRIDRRDDFVAACWTSTDGHPELLQFVGDRLVAVVNGRPRVDVFTSPADIAAVVGHFEYAEQYLETYWGQASPLERVLSILAIEGEVAVRELSGRLGQLGIAGFASHVSASLRMLELYGICEPTEAGYQLKARWFPTALLAYGGKETALQRYLEQLK